MNAPVTEGDDPGGRPRRARDEGGSPDPAAGDGFAPAEVLVWTVGPAGGLERTLRHLTEIPGRPRIRVLADDEGHSAAVRALSLLPRGRLSAEEEAIEGLVRTPRELSVLAAARGDDEGPGDESIAIVTSETFLPPGALERLGRALAFSRDIAAAVALVDDDPGSTSLRIPGASFLERDRLLATTSRRERPEAALSLRGATAIRRSALWRAWPADALTPHFETRTGSPVSAGLARRHFLLALGETWREIGLRVVLADDVWVYRAPHGMPPDEALGSDRPARRIFGWSPRRLLADSSRAADRAVRDVIAPWIGSRRLDPITGLRDVVHAWRHARVRGHPWRGSARLLRDAPAALLRRRTRAAPRALGAPSAPVTPSVTYVLPELSLSGGILSVVQLVNELVLAGVDARIAARWTHPAVRSWPLLTEPIIFRSEAELEHRAPRTDIVVATLWSTAEPVARLARAWSSRAVYFVQDWEPWFFPEGDGAARARVEATYDLIEQKIVKSDWLAGLFAERGHETKKIRLGMDLGTFYPRPRRGEARARILAMARPETPRRGFDTLVRALELVARERPDTEIVLFGTRALASHTPPFAHRDAGVVTDRDELARLYSDADVFVDASDFQGFGRPALEAMACGTACVVSREGGVSEYARGDENCLVAPAGDAVAFAERIGRLLADPTLRGTLREAGLHTAQEYAADREAAETIAWLRGLV